MFLVGIFLVGDILLLLTFITCWFSGFMALVDHWVPWWYPVIFPPEEEKIMFLFTTQAFWPAHILNAFVPHDCLHQPCTGLVLNVYHCDLSLYWGGKECIRAYTPVAVIDGCLDSRRVILAPGDSWWRSIKACINSGSDMRKRTTWPLHGGAKVCRCIYLDLRGTYVHWHRRTL
jgi:hypothetical protein